MNDNNNSQIAVDRAITSYIQARKDKAPEFAKKYFSLRGALGLNKNALGADILKGPLNVLWSLPYMGFKASSALSRKAGLRKIPSLIERLPPGLETRVQKEINWLIFTELLEIPYDQGNRKSSKDALLEEILKQPEISALFSNELSTIYSKSKDPKFRPALEKNLMEYSRSRTAAADLAGTVISLSTGATVFGKMTPGAMTAGGAIATAVAQHSAISNFVLGPTLGGLYYSIFPATASMGLVVASTGTFMALLAILTSFSGIITDPIQHKLGIHQKRLKKLIECLDKELRGSGDSGLKIRDQYVARVFDLLDLFKKAARTFV